jgi:hypothetical protein
MHRESHKTRPSRADRTAGGPHSHSNEAPVAVQPPSPTHQPITETHVEPFNLALEAFDGFMDGMAAPRPKVVTFRPRLLTGTLEIAGLKFPYASGGAGWSIPYGDFPLTPEEVGGWGKRHGAIGINGGTIPDKQLGRDREGIEIHAAHHMASSGCVVVEEFDRLKRAVTRLINDAGHAFLHVGPTGAAITADSASPLPPIIYLAEHIASEERQSKRKSERHYHPRLAHRLPHRKHYSNRHHGHYAATAS